ncbi:MFS transporter [Streptomyces sp. SCSIO 30461]|uniref:MFS transporter n=1 Tax=Streptomyces sp. SCSIO 30461 TaxID=3118085 RepID=UPI0030D5F71F
MITVGMVLTAAGLLVLAGIDPGWGVSQLLPGFLITGMGIARTTTPVTTATMGNVPPAHADTASGTLNASRMLGLSLGIAVMGAVVAAQWPGDLADSVDPKAFADGIAAGFQVNAAIALAAAVLAAVTIHDEPRQRRQRASSRSH